MAHDHHDDELHDHDLGLSHDLPKLVERGTMARRGVLALFGGLGAAGLVACANQDSDATTLSSNDGATTAPGRRTRRCPAGRRRRRLLGHGRGRRDPRGDRRALPGRRLQRRQRAHRDRHRPQRHHLELRQRLRGRRGRPADHQAQGLRPERRGGHRADRRRGLPLALQPRRGVLALLRGRSPPRTTSAGCRRPATDGSLEFTSIFPAAYDGRWPHIHFEVYQSLDDATNATNKLRTSQLALPEDVCNEVYATEGYEASVGNLASTSLSSDMVFSDGYSLQMATVTGSVDEGYVASLNIPV